MCSHCYNLIYTSIVHKKGKSYSPGPSKSFYLQIHRYSTLWARFIFLKTSLLLQKICTSKSSIYLVLTLKAYFVHLQCKVAVKQSLSKNNLLYYGTALHYEQTLSTIVNLVLVQTLQFVALQFSVYVHCNVNKSRQVYNSAF